MSEFLFGGWGRESISAPQIAAMDVAERRLCGLPQTGQPAEARSAPSATRVLMNDAGPTLVRVNMLLHRISSLLTSAPLRIHMDTNMSGATWLDELLEGKPSDHLILDNEAFQPHSRGFLEFSLC